MAGLLSDLPLSPIPLVNPAIAIPVFMVVYWIFEPIDRGIFALIGCYLFWALGVAEFETAFASFANSTPWFLFGAVLMGEAAARSGPPRNIRRNFIWGCGKSLPKVLFNAIAIVLLFEFLSSSGN